LPVNLHTDASVKNKKGRGCVIISKNSQTKGFKSSAGYEEIRLFRTPIMVLDKTNVSSGSDIDYMELRTIISGVLHAFKLHKNEKYFTIYSDSLNSIDKINMPWHEIQTKGLDPLVEKLRDYLSKNDRDIKLRFLHVKAHKGKLESTPSKMNFVCDLFASLKFKI